MPKSTTFSMSMKSLNINNFSIDESSLVALSFEEIKDRINIDIASRIEIDDKEENTRVIIKLSYEDKTTLHTVLAINLETNFLINPFSDVVKKYKKELRFVNDNIAFTLLGLTFSTLRGILFEKLKGTELQKLILPIVNPRLLLNDAKKQQQKLSL